MAESNKYKIRWGGAAFITGEDINHAEDRADTMSLDLTLDLNNRLDGLPWYIGGSVEVEDVDQDFTEVVPMAKGRAFQGRFQPPRGGESFPISPAFRKLLEERKAQQDELRREVKAAMEADIKACQEGEDVNSCVRAASWNIVSKAILGRTLADEILDDLAGGLE